MKMSGAPWRVRVVAVVVHRHEVARRDRAGDDTRRRHVDHHRRQLVADADRVASRASSRRRSCALRRREQRQHEPAVELLEAHLRPACRSSRRPGRRRRGSIRAGCLPRARRARRCSVPSNHGSGGWRGITKLYTVPRPDASTVSHVERVAARAHRPRRMAQRRRTPRSAGSAAGAPSAPSQKNCVSGVIDGARRSLMQQRLRRAELQDAEASAGRRPRPPRRCRS